MKKYILIFTLVAAVVFGGCNSSQKENAIEYAGMQIDGRSFSEVGTTFVEQDIVYFRDYNSGESIPLCNRMNCLHRAPTAEEQLEGKEACLAYYPNCMCAMVYEGRLYVFEKNNEKVNLFKAEMNGTGKKKLVSLEKGVFPQNACYISGGQMWLVAEVSTEENSYGFASKYHIMGIDLANGKLCRFTTEFSEMPNILYYDKDEAMVVSYEENGEQILWKMEKKNQKCTQLLPDEKGLLFLAANRKGVLTCVGEGEEAEGFFYSLDDGSREKVAKEMLGENLYSDSEKIYCRVREYTSRDESTDFICCRNEDGSWNRVKVPENYMLLSMAFARNVFFWRAEDRNMVVVPLNSAMNGDFAPIFVGEYELYSLNNKK